MFIILPYASIYTLFIIRQKQSMGALPFLQSKRQFNRQYFQEIYKETIPAEYYSFQCSKGFRNSAINAGQQNSLPEMLTSPLYELAIKRRGAKIAKKPVGDTTVYPYSCIGLLVASFDGVLRCGTGSLISKNLILTAASNILDKETQRIATSVKFVLNLKGQQGDIFQISPDKIHFHEKYYAEIEGSHRYNYAFLQIGGNNESSANQQQSGVKGVNELKSTPGLTHGYLGFNTNFRGMESVYIFGFSGDLNEKEVQYHLRGEKIDALICKDSSLGYKMESFPSEVGSPIMIRRNQIYEIVGIHMGGKKGLSCGLQFDQQIRGDLNNWIWQMEGSIDLENRSLSAFEINLFTEMDWHNMVIINLDNNKITSEGLQSFTKKAWPMLRQLHLCNNSISCLTLDPSSIMNLQKLHLSQNGLKIITPLAQLPLLTVLYLSDNKIDSIDDLFDLKYLERLDVTINKIRSIGPDIYKLTQLKKIYLSRNQLVTLPVELLKMRSLSVIVADRNKFKPTPTELFERLQLQHVQVILQ